MFCIYLVLKLESGTAVRLGFFWVAYRLVFQVKMAVIT